MKRIAVYGLQVLCGLLFFAAGAAKLAAADIMVHEFDVIGLGQWLRILAGSLEIIGGLCLFIPRVAILGVVLVGGLTIGATGAMIGRVAFLGLDRASSDARQPAIVRVPRA